MFSLSFSFSNTLSTKLSAVFSLTFPLPWVATSVTLPPSLLPHFLNSVFFYFITLPLFPFFSILQFSFQSLSSLPCSFYYYSKFKGWGEKTSIRQPQGRMRLRVQPWWRVWVCVTRDGWRVRKRAVCDRMRDWMDLSSWVYLALDDKALGCVCCLSDANTNTAKHTFLGGYTHTCTHTVQRHQISNFLTYW